MRRAWWVIVHRIAKSQTPPKQLHTQSNFLIIKADFYFKMLELILFFYFAISFINSFGYLDTLLDIFDA